MHAGRTSGRAEAIGDYLREAYTVFRRWVRLKSILIFALVSSGMTGSPVDPVLEPELDMSRTDFLDVPCTAKHFYCPKLCILLHLSTLEPGSSINIEQPSQSASEASSRQRP